MRRRHIECGLRVADAAAFVLWGWGASLLTGPLRQGLTAVSAFVADCPASGITYWSIFIEEKDGYPRPRESCSDEWPTMDLPKHQHSEN